MLILNVFYGYAKVPRVIDLIAIPKSEILCFNNCCEISKDDYEKIIIENYSNNLNFHNIRINSFDFACDKKEELIKAEKISKKGTYCFLENDSRIIIYSKEMTHSPNVLVLHNLNNYEIKYYLVHDRSVML